MNTQVSLAVKYRPNKFDDLVSQEAIKTILQNQLETKTFKHSYLFTGPAGCGKTTSARIFANEINNHKGNPIEMDAASNSGVDDVREIIKQAQSQSLDSEYKVFIIDECHSISNTGWQAFLKLIEEPPLKSIFIFCTTNPEKIPKTILSRVQRYDFNRMTNKEIIGRLEYVCKQEDINIDNDSLVLIAQKADGGMRDSLTYLDKVVSYVENNNIVLKDTISALDIISYDIIIDLLKAIVDKKDKDIIDIIEELYLKGYDLKTFVSDIVLFILELCKHLLGITDITIPNDY